MLEEMKNVVNECRPHYDINELVWFLKPNNVKLYDGDSQDFNDGKNDPTMFLTYGRINSLSSVDSSCKKYSYCIDCVCPEIEGWTVCTVLEDNILSSFNNDSMDYRIVATNADLSNWTLNNRELIPSYLNHLHKKVWIYDNDDHDLRVGIVTGAYTKKSEDKTFFVIRMYANNGYINHDYVVLSDVVYPIEDTEGYEAVNYYCENPTLKTATMSYKLISPLDVISWIENIKISDI